MTSLRDYATDKAWNYLRDEGRIKQYSRFEERAGGLYELIVLDGWPAKVKSNRPDGCVL